jgi:putative ATPase
MSLFDTAPIAAPATSARHAPLAERMRPRALADYAGQQHLLAPGKPLRLAIESDDPTSMIFWGPPGTGKTTLAKIIAAFTHATFIEFSAVLSGIKEIKAVMADAEKASTYGSRTILFVDEIHRFNRAQQDAFLPYVERGTIRLIGATTENPSFELNAALLSRCRVYTLVALAEPEIVALLTRALTALTGLNNAVAADPDALALIASYSSGDARTALNALEVAATLALSTNTVILSEVRSAQSKDPEAPHPNPTAQPFPLPHPAQHSPATDIAETFPSPPPAAPRITKEIAAEALQRRILLYDKSGEQHYDMVSALHKSVRNSDPDAALYWLARMLHAGEDPMYVARRIVRMAVEDIGLAAPEALNLCLSARDAMHFLGHPEGDLALAQAVTYLALAPKSNAVYTAYSAVLADVEATAAQPVPLHLRNAPTRLMKSLDYGKDYQYAHDLPGKVAVMQCLPDNLRDRRYYHPTHEGRERALAQRLEELTRLRQSQPE